MDGRTTLAGSSPRRPERPRTRHRDRQAEFAGVHHSDRWISSRLLRLLRFDTTVNAHSIAVKALTGKVILSGAVTSSAERSVAETLARRLPGVTEVDSRLIIERPR